MASHRDRDAFWATIPLRGKAMFFGAVFCVFGPGLVLPLRLADPAPGAALIAMTVSGLIGTFWALAFTRNLWYIAAAIALQGASAIAFAGLAPQWLWPRVVGVYPLGLIGFLLVVAGYALFVAFIATEGRRSVRERTELALAQRIHASLAPPIHLASHGYELFGRSMPSAEVGGDLIDVVETPEGLSIVVGDVTGHGVRSGVVMAMTKSAIHTARAAGSDLPHVLQTVDAVLDKLTEPGMFVTLAALQAGRDGAVEYALAGHLPILHWLAAERRICRLENESLPLGVLPGGDFPLRCAQMAPGDLLVLLTDGFIEAPGPDGRQLGLDRFEQFVLEQADLPLARLLERLVELSCAAGPILDDQTLLLIRRG